MRSRQRNRGREGTPLVAKYTRFEERPFEELLKDTTKSAQSEYTDRSRHTSPSGKNILKYPEVKKSPRSKNSSPKCPAEHVDWSSASEISLSDGRSFTPNEDDQIMLKPEPPPTPKVPPTTEGQDRKIKGICMRGTGDWEPVNAKLDLSSKYSILDSKAASELGLTLHPIPRQMVSEKHLSHSSYLRPQFWASSVGLRSSNVGLEPGSIQIPTARIDILVAHVKTEHEDAHLIIGRTLHRMLEAGKEKMELGAKVINDFGLDFNREAGLHGSGQEGFNPQSVLESLSAGQEEFAMELGENTFASFPGNLASIGPSTQPPRPLFYGR